MRGLEAKEMEINYYAGRRGQLDIRVLPWSHFRLVSLLMVIFMLSELVVADELSEMSEGLYTSVIKNGTGFIPVCSGEATLAVVTRVELADSHTEQRTSTCTQQAQHAAASMNFFCVSLQKSDICNITAEMMNSMFTQCGTTWEATVHYRCITVESYISACNGTVKLNESDSGFIASYDYPRSGTTDVMECQMEVQTDEQFVMVIEDCSVEVNNFPVCRKGDRYRINGSFTIRYTTLREKRGGLLIYYQAKTREYDLPEQPGGTTVDPYTVPGDRTSTSQFSPDLYQRDSAENFSMTTVNVTDAGTVITGDGRPSGVLVISVAVVCFILIAIVIPTAMCLYKRRTRRNNAPDKDFIHIVITPSTPDGSADDMPDDVVAPPAGNPTDQFVFDKHRDICYTVPTGGREGENGPGIISPESQRTDKNNEDFNKSGGPCEDTATGMICADKRVNHSCEDNGINDRCENKRINDSCEEILTVQNFNNITPDDNYDDIRPYGSCEDLSMYDNCENEGIFSPGQSDPALTSVSRASSIGFLTDTLAELNKIFNRNTYKTLPSSYKYLTETEDGRLKGKRGTCQSDFENITN